MSWINLTESVVMDAKGKLNQLRQLMRTHRVDAYIIPSADAHNSEYAAACDARRTFISGFSGSAGTAIVTLDHGACLWTDPRYFIQAEQQLDTSLWKLMKDGLPQTPKREEWLLQTLPESATIGVDPTLMSHDLYKKFSEYWGSNLQWKQLKENLVDIVWGEERPARPCNPVMALADDYTGCDMITKLAHVREAMVKNRSDLIVVQDLADIAWVLNLRGSDILMNPCFFSYMIIGTGNLANLYIDKHHLSKVELPENITVKPYEEIYRDLEEFATHEPKLVIEMEYDTNLALYTSAGGSLHSKSLNINTSPLKVLKSIKNNTEIEGFRKCHIRDGAALVRYFAWLEEQLVNKKAEMTEYESGLELEKYRSEQEHYMGLSFEAIIGCGPNGAIIHYKPEKETSAILDPNQVILVDSGGQYLDGTTDVTRTVHFGTPTPQEKRAYTAVLKGHIALDQAVFPTGVHGVRLDAFARQFLWQYGLDYGHGTGHGVGHFLNVHEGPQSISPRGSTDNPATALKPGMTVTNEPGYYEPHSFGIRIEDVLIVVPHSTIPEYLKFENVTMAPMCKALMDYKIMTPSELLWVDQYHQKVCATLEPLLEKHPNALEWLRRETRPIK